MFLAFNQEIQKGDVMLRKDVLEYDKVADEGKWNEQAETL